MGNFSQQNYPLLFVRGFAAPGWRYWGRLPQYLYKKGYHVYFSTQDAWGDVFNNALYLAGEVRALKKHIGVEKFHIFAHSKGGLESRYFISLLDGHRDVASLTTFGTPHRGISLIEDMAVLPSFVKEFTLQAFNRIGRNQGDGMPNVMEALRDMTPSRMRYFNQEVINHPDVFYRSVAAVLDYTKKEYDLAVLRRKLYEEEGPNDGLVSVYSALWGDQNEIWRRAGTEGISHRDLCDYHKQNISIYRSGAGHRKYHVFALYDTLIKELG